MRNVAPWIQTIPRVTVSLHGPSPRGRVDDGMRAAPAIACITSPPFRVRSGADRDAAETPRVVQVWRRVYEPHACDERSSAAKDDDEMLERMVMARQ